VDDVSTIMNQLIPEVTSCPTRIRDTVVVIGVFIQRALHA
jgi:hypothetical protein